MTGLTPTQARAFEFIKTYIGEHGCSPSYEEIMGHMGLKAKSGVYRIVNELVERKAIARIRYRARAIRVLERHCPHCGGPI